MSITHDSIVHQRTGEELRHKLLFHIPVTTNFAEVPSLLGLVGSVPVTVELAVTVS
jgi:hypothetical protein